MIRDVNANHAELMSGVDMSIHEPTNGAYVHSLEPVATLRDFPAMPNLAAEHIAAVRKHLNGGRTTAELEARARMRFATSSMRRRFTPVDVLSIRARRTHGEPLASISLDYGVRENTISRICRGITYREVA